MTSNHTGPKRRRLGAAAALLIAAAVGSALPAVSPVANAAIAPQIFTI